MNLMGSKSILVLLFVCFIGMLQLHDENVCAFKIEHCSPFFFSTIQFHLISTGLVELQIPRPPQALEGMFEMSYSTIPSLCTVRPMLSLLQHSPGTKMDNC